MMDIREFPLAWRWTDPNYALLPENILTQLHPEPRDVSRGIFQTSLKFIGTDGLNEYIAPLSKIAVLDTESDSVARWLASLPVQNTARIFLSWDSDTALQTSWEVFYTYWSEFCYPGSDDLMVYPADQSWVLLYHHEEEMQFMNLKYE